MKIEGRKASTNVRDLRGRGAVMGGGLGCGGMALVVVISLVFGLDPVQMLSAAEEISAQVPREASVSTAPTDDPQVQFVSVVLGDTERVWQGLFRAQGKRYSEPVLNVFERSVPSACGYQSAAVGPFYCPSDSSVYLDLSFFRQLSQGLGAPGDFAAAYVVAHEVGHHVQNLLGTSAQVHQARQRARSEAEANELSVRLELQADCYAGVWGHHAARDDMLDAGDVEEGLRAAAAIGDDRLQMKSRGSTVPESWTHGSSAQRQQWLTTGLKTGDPNACDTFR